ncbi:galactokinase [Maribacter thermophilus]|uniref:galactokinase n=1 Tax=Maribacter thermophilus TaxID=1197874 RepID=UPI000640CBD1|nr:galactokinase [Maribacter thermophilus]
MVHTKVKDFFISKYGNSPIMVKSPGRVNLIGEHTDYNMGLVLPASIEKAIYFAVHKNDSDHITVETFLTLPEQISFDLEGKHEPFNAFWGNYFKAIIEILIEKKYTLKGFDCVFGGDIPIGSGLSSSAALCCGFIYALSNALDLSITREEIALIAQQAEHKIGLNCGLMDQYAVLFGRKSNALFLDCKDLTHKYIPINLNGYSWVLINSNIKHNLAVDSEYNKRRTSCELVFSKVGETKNDVNSMRDVTLTDLENCKPILDEKDYKRAKYVIEENNRVLKMIEYLESGNADETGKTLLQGHWAMSKEFEITTPELDFLVKTGQKLDGFMGARMMGGGFGGCTINLIKTEAMENIVDTIISAYKKETGIDAEVYHLYIDDGVHIMK